MSDTDNNSKNFFITGFGGTSNRDISVYPAPDTMTADTTFSLATVGKSLIVPSSNFVSASLPSSITSPISTSPTCSPNAASAASPSSCRPPACRRWNSR
jgi:hypothetical protein